MGNSKDGNDNNGFSFGSMMSYMVYQNRVEWEQRDHQNRIDAEHSEHEYELRREELAVQRKKSCAQGQLMNAMMMAIINRNNKPKNNSTPDNSSMNN